MKKLQNKELVKLMGGVDPVTNISSTYTLAGSTVIWDPISKEQQSQLDSDPCDDDLS